MKKQTKITKKNKAEKPKKPIPKQNGKKKSIEKVPQKNKVLMKPAPSARKKTMGKKGVEDRAILGYISKSRQFLRESKIELKKVKWPTKKELLASTAVVIFLSIVMAFYFWLVDMGLVAIIKGLLA